MPTVTTNYFRQKFAEGNINLSGDTFYVALMNGYVSSTENTLKAQSAWADISGNESSSVGYSAAVISGDTLSMNGNIVKWDGDDITWNAITNSPYGLCIYKNDGVIVGFIEFEEQKVAVNGSITIQWNSNGIANII